MRAAAMIIGMCLVFPAQAQLWGSNPAKLPDPVRFVIEMELGNLAQATTWLDAGMPVDFMGSRIGNGLMIGAWEGKIPLMELFLSRGADINQMNANGESAIALAAWRGQLPAVKWLLERGAKVNAPERQWSALHYAVFAGHQEVADFLMAQGADINALTTNGSSVLMMAIYEGHDGLAKQLIEKGADRQVKNDWDDGALEWAMRNNRLNVARMLTNPEEFNIAVSQPKEKWGEPRRSLRSSKELDDLLAMRQKLVERKMSVDTIDKRIAAERVRIVRSEMDKSNKPVRAATLEITASRKSGEKQSANIIYDDNGKAVGYKAPAATYYGMPKMPPRGNVKSY
jgi:hypothetical protein